MGEAYLGEVRYFGGNYAPKDWAFCDGQIVAISSNPALYSLLGTTYGGDGRSTFALPEIRGRVVMGQGTGPGIPGFPLGYRGGQEYTPITSAEIPAHTHAVTSYNPSMTRQASNTQGTISAPADNTRLADKYFVNDSRDLKGFHPNDAAANPETLGGVHVSANADLDYWGSTPSQQNPIENRMPVLAISVIICTNGIYPARP